MWSLTAFRETLKCEFRRSVQPHGGQWIDASSTRDIDNCSAFLGTHIRDDSLCEFQRAEEVGFHYKMGFIMAIPPERGESQ